MKLKRIRKCENITDPFFCLKNTLLSVILQNCAIICKIGWLS